MVYSQQMAHGRELANEEFRQAAELIHSFPQHLSVKGVLSGVVAGRVFLAHDGKLALLTSPQGMIFLGGNPTASCEGAHPFLWEINQLLAKELLPSLASDGELDYVLFYPSDDDVWQAALELVMKDILPMRSGRMTFTCDPRSLDHIMDDRVMPLTLSLLKQENLTGAEELIDEILEVWPSLEAFEGNGFGCVAVQHTGDGPAIISWCLTDWVVGNECELGIETDEGYRNQGWARKTVSGALLLAKQRGITRVGWQCWSSNIGSQRTALSVGFKQLADFPVLFGWNLPLNNLLVNGNHYMHGDERYGVGKDYARSAWSYSQALDQGWDWGGDAALYWNAACMFYLTGEQERAVHFYKLAIEKGWADIPQPHDHVYVYREADSEVIARTLAEACR
ncbi:GNAT family N-acetyltransferase [Paenibacillus sp. S-12]|uniref:GNAT family N-acetyltransferase n=1 Tax=unclassified Paenibacillus TaxID=185978 RepID=UPI0025A14957|nr:GNAT family N-acetyltransferase [Paenibacillus sp. S-12]